ncbi:SusC/RagA family TonB-linked outer membrane protein [Flavitalea flava]
MPFKTNVAAIGCCLAFMLLSASSLFAQKQITGKIFNNADKQPLAGATIQVKGTKVATQSASDGSFTITPPNDNNTGVLVISSVGFTRLEIPFSGRSTVGEIMLSNTGASLNEIVVTGYTSQRKKDITGSVSVVDVKSLKSVPSGTTEALLQGQAPGVTVINSGVPGGGSNVRIRGITSFGNSDPLVIIDGTPGSLHDLNVNDIESLQVLKDAGAAAIYGVRGSNGVVIVTTKRGKQGKTQISYDGYMGSQRPLSGNVFNIANPTETANAVWQEFANSGLPINTTTYKNSQYGYGTTPVIPDYITPTAGKNGDPNTDPSTYALYSNQITKANKNGTDWFHTIFKPAIIQSHTVSGSGGNEKNLYYFSLGYLDQQGTMLNTYLKRYTARINTTFNVKDHVRIGENAFIIYRRNPGFQNNNLNEGNAISHSYREDAIIPVLDIKGNFAGTNSKGLGNPQNPFAIQTRATGANTNDWQMNGNVFAEVDFLKHFTARSSFGGTVENIYNTQFGPTFYENAENNSNPNTYSEISGYGSNWAWTNTLKYSNKFDRHSISVIVGSEAIKNFTRVMAASRGSYYITNPANLTVDPNLWTLNFGSPSGQTNTSTIAGVTYPIQSSLYSLFGRVDYTYNDKYILSGTLRRDGSSIFLPDQRFGVFPSVTVGWRISKEDFLKDVSWLSDLKLRGGWGKLGSLSNARTTNAFSLFGQSAPFSSYDINGTGGSGTSLGTYASQFGNPVTTWEQDKITNIAIDGAILNNNLEFTIEWYKKTVSGLLFNAPIAATAGGAVVPFTNTGNVENTGIDLALTYHGTVNRDLKFDITADFTSYKNKVIGLANGVKYQDKTSAGSNRFGAFTRLMPGQPVGEFFGYEVAGIFKDAGEVTKANQQDAAVGRFKYKDINGDGKITDKDRTFFGNPNPKFTTGLSIGASYKGFDFSTFFYASVGNDVINYVKYWTDFPQVFDAAMSKDAALHSFGQPGWNGKTPILERSANFSNTTVFNSYYKENGSYLRCKQLQFGYSIPVSHLNRFGLARFRVYVQVANLFTITKYTGLDPELQTSDLNNNTNFGIDFGNYPANQKNYNLGVQITF